ncbi:MAG: GtrA family protein [Deltaproteobacteria bacterium]
MNERLKRFLIVGSSAAIVNFALMIFFVEALSFNTYVLKNIANAISMEVSVFYNFLLSRIWTWGDAPKRQGKGLVSQFISFNLAALTGILVRIIIFAALEKFGVFYLLNLTIGIGLAALVDFILYDKLIFRRALDGKETL